ncbi:MAG TPA: hypothetical protein VK841_00685 [Polyangiaceae bacterium]|jgi:hypothetical protein|nr:hypothetical protein [Polyangiaceae bacterium]
MAVTEPNPEDVTAIRDARAVVLASAPRSEEEWLALHDEVHRIADCAPHPWIVVANVAEALVNCRPAACPPE